MSTQVQLRRGTTSQHSTFTGAIGELTVDTTKKVPVVHDGATVGGFPIARADQVYSTDQSTAFLASLAMEQAELSPSNPIAAGPGSVGIFDGFNVLTFVDVAGATALDTTVPGQLKPASTNTTVGQTATPANGPINFSAVTIVDRSYTLTNAQVVTKIGLYSTAAVSCTLKVVRRNSAGNYDVVVSQAFSHPGGGWASLTLPAPYTVPATGTFHVAMFYSVSQTIETYTASANRSAYTGNATGNGVTFTETTGALPATNAVLATPPASMAVASTGLVLPSAPTWGRLFAFAKLQDATLGTDLLFDATRDGANWQALAMSQSYVRPDGSVALDSGKFAFTSASGTTGKWRARMANSKLPSLLAIGIMMGS